MKKPGVGFLEDQTVVAGVRAKPMVEDLRRPVVLIEPRIEEAFVAGVPHTRPGRVRDDVRQIVADREIAGPQA